MITVNGIQYQISREFGDIRLTAIDHERIILGGFDDLMNDACYAVRSSDEPFEYDIDEAKFYAESNLEAYAEKYFSQSEILVP